MPLFNFALRPLDEVEPWGTVPELSLAWFGLTDGYYWIDAGGEQLFRYSDEALTKWPKNDFAGPYMDYHVIRLYQDLTDILLYILQPIPPSLQPYIRDAFRPGSWCDTCREYGESDLGDIPEERDRAYLAQGWASLRRLDTLYSTCGPTIWFWREDDAVTLAWDNSRQLVGDVKAWQSESGSYSLPIDEFLAEMHSFEDRLIGQMWERINAIAAHWARPEIHIDVDGLFQEHKYREGMLQRALNAQPEELDAPAIEAAIRRIVESV